MKKINSKVTPHPIVYIRWLDHNTFDGAWIQTSEVPVGPLVIETVGFLVDEDKLSYHVISSVYGLADTEVCRGFWYILKSDVEEIVKL